MSFNSLLRTSQVPQKIIGKVLLATLFTLLLTNCGKIPAKDQSSDFIDPAQDFVADTPNTWMKLDESDLENYANLKERYYISKWQAYVDPKTDGYFEKIKESFDYDKNAHTFTITENKVSHAEFGLSKQTFKSTYTSEAPFTLISQSIDSSFPTALKGKAPHTVHHTLNCKESACVAHLQYNKSKFAHTYNVSDHPLPTLFDFFQNEKIKSPPRQLKTKYFMLGRSGIESNKIYSNYTDTQNPNTVTLTKIRILNSNYLQKDFLSISPSWGQVEIKNEMYSTSLVTKEAFDLVTDDKLSAPADTLEFVKPKKINKQAPIRAIVIGDNRKFIPDTEFQKVIHLDFASVVELGRQKKDTLSDYNPENVRHAYESQSDWMKELKPKLDSANDFDTKIKIAIASVRAHIRPMQMLGTLNADELSQIKKGDCSELSKALLQVLTQSDIDTRRKSGFVFPFRSLYSAKPEVFGHAWNEVYEPNAGWTYADAALAGFRTPTFAMLLDMGATDPDNWEMDDYSVMGQTHTFVTFDEESFKATMDKIRGSNPFPSKAQTP